MFYISCSDQIVWGFCLDSQGIIIFADMMARDGGLTTHCPKSQEANI